MQEMPNLTAFGATEYMDGALTLAVLNELFLRGVPSCGRGRQLRGRLQSFDVQDQDSEEEERERRQDCKDLEAIDLRTPIQRTGLMNTTKAVQHAPCVSMNNPSLFRV